MAVTFRDLCAQQHLGLRFHGEQTQLEREIRWVTTTELEDPTPWLTGGELVLTTRLWQKSASAQTRLVANLDKAGAAGFGFATGPAQRQRPEFALEKAHELGMPVVEAPYDAPFIAVARFVAEQLFEQEHAQQRWLTEAHDKLAQALLSGQGLHALMRSLHTLTGAPAGLVDLHGQVLASHPRDYQWPPAQSGSTGTSAGTVTGTLSTRLIEIAENPVAVLCSHATTALELLPYAERLIGLELAKRQAVLEARRQLAGQVIHDILRRIISAEEAERRLASFDIPLAEPHTVILATADCAPDRLRSVPWALFFGQPTGSHDLLTALVGRQVVVLVPEHQPATAVGHQLARHLSQVGQAVSVGVGGCYSGADGLRWSYLEAQDALTRGPGVHERAHLDLTRALLSNPDLPLRHLAARLLRPLLTCDRDHNTQLIATLRTFFVCNESVTLTAARLFVHRNTVHHRLRLIEKLTSLSLSSTQDRIQLWLAIRATAEPDPEATDHRAS